MRIKFLLLILVVLCANAAITKTENRITCQVDEAVMNGEKRNVPVNGEATHFKGMVFSATWFAGDRYEPQTFLSMGYGDLSSTMYDIKLEERAGLGPLNVMWNKKNIRFQCGVSPQ